MTAIDDVKALYERLLTMWNRKDAGGYAELFTGDGTLVGYDGSCVESAASIGEHLGAIFADHDPATYVAKVVEARPLGEGSMLLRGVAGMVPPGDTDIIPERNAIHVLVGVDDGRGWRVAHFQNTPAAFDGRPEAAESLTAELRAELTAGRGAARDRAVPSGP